MKSFQENGTNSGDIKCRSDTNLEDVGKDSPAPAVCVSSDHSHSVGSEINSIVSCRESEKKPTPKVKRRRKLTRSTGHGTHGPAERRTNSSNLKKSLTICSTKSNDSNKSSGSGKKSLKPRKLVKTPDPQEKGEWGGSMFRFLSWKNAVSEVL